MKTEAPQSRQAQPAEETARPKAAPSPFKVLFLISLLYYVFWLFICIAFAFTGIEAGWLIPSLSSGEKEYGLAAFSDGIGMCGLYTLVYFWFIPLYQIIYLIVSGIRWLIRRRKKSNTGD